MLYFAYGSNMCTGRLKRRVPSATALKRAKLLCHSFKFHKRSTDKSAKGDALDTSNAQDMVWGVIFEIDEEEKPSLDAAEGLGQGYVENETTVVDDAETEHRVWLYVADPSYIDTTLRPYSWYKRFVLDGARQHDLPNDYINLIAAMPEMEDPDRGRDRQNRSITC